MKKAILIVSFLILAACGEAKITKIDGTSSATADRSFKKMTYGMPSGDSLKWEIEVNMLKSRYGDEFAKRFDGKTLEDLKPDIADTKTYFIKINRERHAATEQEQIDALQVKLAGFEADGESNIKYVMIAQTKGRIDMYTKSRDEILALSDEQAWKKFGCGCEKTDYKPSGNYSNSTY